MPAYYSLDIQKRLSVAQLSAANTVDARFATAEEREAGFRSLVLLYSMLMLFAGIFAWYAIPREERASDVEFSPLKGMGVVLRRPVI